MKYVAILLLVVILLVPPFFALREELPAVSLEKPVVLVVGNSDSQDPFGPNVAYGVEKATDHVQELVADLALQQIAIRSKAGKTIERQILDAVATRNVVAVVAATTSQHAAKVQAIGRTLRIPVLFTVATYADLLRTGGGWSFRLPASDRLQADAILRWINASQGVTRTAILYDNGVYGRSLKELLLQRCRPLACLTFELTAGVDIAAVLERGRAAGVTAWVLAGYTSQGLDFVSKKTALAVPGRILLSDGCYGGWLKTARIPDAVLSFPTPDVASEHKKLHDVDVREGFAPLGHDAVVLIAYAIHEARRRNGDRETVRELIASGVAARTADKVLLFSYSFNEHGENTNARFATSPLMNRGQQ